MTNSSVFPVTVSFSFLHGGQGVHSHIAPPGDAPPGPPLAEGEKPPTPDPPPERPANPPQVFFASPTTLTLEPDESLDVLLSAFPECDGLFEEQLVCTIADNPEPVLFPISAIGSSPKLELDAKKIEFERLLLRRSDYKTLTLYSRSAMPLRWEIRAEDLLEVTWGGEEGDPGCEDFTLAPTAGLLPPGGQASIKVGFHARASKEFSRKFTIDVFDAAVPSVLGVAHSLEVARVRGRGRARVRVRVRARARARIRVRVRAIPNPSPNPPRAPPPPQPPPRRLLPRARRAPSKG